MNHRLRERGQALILIALAFVGLAAFIGLAVDGGILFTDIGHLRRAVDAGALAAANQYRRNVPPSDLEHAAQELLELNNLSAATAVVKVCDWDGSNPSYMDVSLCPAGFPTPTERFKKKVRVEGSMPVRFAFLPIIGIDEITIHADAVSEAAALDLVLVIDESELMAYDGADQDPVTCRNGVPNDDPSYGCHPFKEVARAARSFVTQMYFPFDRVSVIGFSSAPTTSSDPDFTDLVGDGTTVRSAIDAMNPQPLPPCPGYAGGDVSGCMSTNIADGLLSAHDQLAANGDPEAVWVVVLLTDGAANQAYDHTNSVWFCPGSDGNHDWIPPRCRDGVFTLVNGTREPAVDNPGVYGYDAEDAARDVADLVGCRGNGDPDQSSYCSTNGIDGVGALMFTIGLGDKVINDPDDGRAGERLLRQIAVIGDDGDPATNPCNPDPAGWSELWGLLLRPHGHWVGSRVRRHRQTHFYPPYPIGRSSVVGHLRRYLTRRSTRTWGQSLAEFALVLPVMLLLIFIIIEGARLLFAWLAVENGARFGIRYAVTGNYDPAYYNVTDCNNFYSEYGLSCTAAQTDREENAARLLSTFDAAWAGSVGIQRDPTLDRFADWATPGLFKVTVCSDFGRELHRSQPQQLCHGLDGGV